MKKHKETFLLEFFSLVRKERKGQKEECFPLLNSFCRLAATGANKVPRPSRYSINMATGSKRSSADSDSLLCHVRLWRTSRLEFGCETGCEHSKIGFVSAIYVETGRRWRRPLQYEIQTPSADKIKNILFTPSARISHPRCPVSATPTEFASKIVNSPLEKAGDTHCFS